MLLLEALQLALLIGCSVVSVLLILRMQAHEEESRILREDVRIVRAETQRWRTAVEDHLRLAVDLSLGLPSQSCSISQPSVYSPAWVWRLSRWPRSRKVKPRRLHQQRRRNTRRR